MSLPRLERWRRSLLVQMVVLTVITFIFGFVYLTVIPYLQFIKSSDVLTATNNMVESELFRAIDDPEGRRMGRLRDSEILANVSAVNKNFRYYVSKGDSSVQFGSAPKWRDAVDISLPNIARHSETISLDECVTYGYWHGLFEDEAGMASVSYRVCGSEETYIEFAGVTSPLEHPVIAGPGFAIHTWYNVRLLLMLGLLFILIVGSVLLVAARSLRRVAAIAESFDADAYRTELLPEHGIPIEVLPLVRAINEMMQRVRNSQEQQNFFLATAAHEIRTPMAVLRLRLEELPESRIKRELRTDVSRLVKLVEQLLRLMSIQNKDKLPDDVDLVVLARQVIAERAPLALERGIDIELISQTDSVIVAGDDSLLQVALSNLVDNSISFSSSGDSLIVSVDRQGEITVQDDGPGIAAENPDTVFEPFAKYPPNREGHGLGLAIVKAIMNLHGGSVSAANGHSGGAKFSLLFSPTATQP